MAITRPPALNELHVEDFDQNQPVTEDTIRKLIQNMNMLRALSPIGMVKAYHVEIPGVKLPDINLYNLCDGSNITASESPLFGFGATPTPDMRDKFFCGKPAGGGPATGGNATLALEHTHATQNYNADVPGSQEYQEYDQQLGWRTKFHNHGNLPAGPLGPTSDGLILNPIHMKMCFYLRVNK
jgi:hypothetical protein